MPSATTLEENGDRAEDYFGEMDVWTLNSNVADDKNDDEDL